MYSDRDLKRISFRNLNFLGKHILQAGKLMPVKNVNNPSSFRPIIIKSFVYAIGLSTHYILV